MSSIKKIVKKRFFRKKVITANIKKEKERVITAEGLQRKHMKELTKK